MLAYTRAKALAREWILNNSAPAVIERDLTRALANEIAMTRGPISHGAVATIGREVVRAFMDGEVARHRRSVAR